MAAVEAGIESSGWRGVLSLRFARPRERTVIARRRHEGPFCVQQPFYPGDGACHVYLLHPPGGLAAGDELLLDVDVDARAAALLTTPASTKFYRSDGAPSVQSQALRVASGASLEWLPLDTILFGGSRARIATDVFLEPGARFVGWEATVLGRARAGDRYESGSLDMRTQIHVAGEPLLIERLRVSAGARALRAPWGLAGFAICGALYAYPADEDLLARVRARVGAAAQSIESLPEQGPTPGPRGDARGARYGATLLGRLLVVRALAHDLEELRAALEAVWCELRPAVVGLDPSAPRVWKT